MLGGHHRLGVNREGSQTAGIALEHRHLYWEIPDKGREVNATRLILRNPLAG